jgi:TusA-related sulfurtransferase
MERVIDCKGMACPLPVVNAKKTAEELKSGDVLTVLVDNEIAVQNLTRFAEHKGFGVRAEKKADKEYAVVMKIGGSAAKKLAKENNTGCSTCPNEPENGTQPRTGNARLVNGTREKERQ